jgi:hypothetical protein
MQTIERWNIFEVELTGPAEGNPFLDVEIRGEFSIDHRRVEVDGFYDGDGVYRIRFMPDTVGAWSYVIRSNASELDGHTGSFTCDSPAPGNHGPVRVRNRTRFAYEDGTPFLPVGTTCYVWNHQGEELEQATLRTLESAPFNKMRMCVFPKHYVFNQNEPELYPFEGEPLTSWDFERFNPAFFRHLETRIADLRDLGIQADLILFHPYDRWGFSTMPAAVDDRYLRYTVARLAAFRNVWWSFANEYDLMKDKNEADWDRFFKLVQRHDPYQHLRSVHNCRPFYDHGKPWVTHCSVQHHDLARVETWIEQYGKPVVVDECGYEGTIPRDWGNLTAHEMVHRFWTGFALGGYVGHGETYPHGDEILWWSKGEVLLGESPPRIAFLRSVFEDAQPKGYARLPAGGKTGEAAPAADRYLWYNGGRQPAWRVFRLPEDHTYRGEVLDTWEMTVTALDGTYSGEVTVELPPEPYMAVRFTRIS